MSQNKENMKTVFKYLQENKTAVRIF